MNTKVITQVVFVIAILASLAGCNTTITINPSKDDGSNVETQTPTITPTEPLLTNEPLLTITPKPTATPIPTLTPTGEPVISKIPIIALLYEQFDDPASEFGQNPNHWVKESWNPARSSHDYHNVSLKNVSGTAQFELLSDDWDLFRIRTTTLRKISEASIFESKLKLDSNSNDGQCRAHMLMMLYVPLSQGLNWYTTCGILDENRSPGFECVVAYEGSDPNHKMAYGTERIPVNLGEWHSTRIEVSPDNYELKYYLDDEFIGSYLPSDADVLLNKRFYLYIQLHGCGDVVGHVDDILLARYP